MWLAGESSLTVQADEVVVGADRMSQRRSRPLPVLQFREIAARVETGRKKRNKGR